MDHPRAGPLCLLPVCLLQHLVESLGTEPMPQVRRAWSAHLQGWTSSVLTASALGLQDLIPETLSAQRVRVGGNYLWKLTGGN